MAWHLRNQVLEAGEVRLFEGSDGYDDGEQRRDFIYVGDVVEVVLFFLDHPELSGIFNTGTGRAQPKTKPPSKIKKAGTAIEPTGSI